MSDARETATAIVRDGLRSVRIALGETTAAAEDYAPRHATKEEPC